MSTKRRILVIIQIICLIVFCFGIHHYVTHCDECGVKYKQDEAIYMTYDCSKVLCPTCAPLYPDATIIPVPKEN